MGEADSESILKILVSATTGTEGPPRALTQPGVEGKEASENGQGSLQSPKGHIGIFTEVVSGKEIRVEETAGKGQAGGDGGVTGSPGARAAQPRHRFLPGFDAATDGVCSHLILF